MENASAGTVSGTPGTVPTREGIDVPRKANVWYRKPARGWYTTLNGKQTPLGVHDPDDLEAARAALDRLIAARAATANPSVHPTPQANSVDDWRAKVGEWIAHKTALKLKPKTLKEYRWNLDKWLTRFGNAPRTSITAAAVEEHSHSFGWGVNQRTHYLRTASAFLAWCGLVVRVRTPGLQSAGAECVIPVALHLRAVAAAPGDLGPLLSFMWHTGCRPSEACNLAAECVDWTNGVVKLREHKTAGKGKARTLYLSPAALEVLTSQKAKHGATGPLFRTKHGRAYLRTGVTQTMGRLSEKLGARITAYGYRHTYATRALELGLPDTHVAALLGHASTKMIHAHYSHIDQNARLLMEAARKVA